MDEQLYTTARNYIQQLCADTGCSLEDLPGAIDDRDGWREMLHIHVQKHDQDIQMHKTFEMFILK